MKRGDSGITKHKYPQHKRKIYTFSNHEGRPGGNGVVVCSVGRFCPVSESSQALWPGVFSGCGVHMWGFQMEEGPK